MCSPPVQVLDGRKREMCVVWGVWGVGEEGSGKITKARTPR